MLKHIQSSEEWNEKSLGAKGFTLIELLVVIVILGILAAVVVFAVSGIKDRGQDSACKTDSRTMRTAAEAYIAQQGNPTTAISNSNGSVLVTAGFLSEPSTNYTVSITTTGTVSVNGVGKCA